MTVATISYKVNEHPMAVKSASFVTRSIFTSDVYFVSEVLMWSLSLLHETLSSFSNKTYHCSSFTTYHQMIIFPFLTNMKCKIFIK